MKSNTSTSSNFNSYADQLIQQRRNDYISELTALKGETMRQAWHLESTQIGEELARMTSRPRSDLVIPADAFPALAKARFRYNRDMALMLHAAGISTKPSNVISDGGLLQKVWSFLQHLMTFPARPQARMA